MADLRKVVQSTVAMAIESYLVDKARRGINTEHVILDKIFPTERRVRSIIGGLETSLGSRLWEVLAFEIAKLGGFEILDHKQFLMPVPLPPEIQKLISDWHTRRLGTNAGISLEGYCTDVRRVARQLPPNRFSLMRVPQGEGVDLWLRKDNKEYVFDIKTVQINAKNGNSFSLSIMNWYAYRLVQYPEIYFRARIAFPYNPYKKMDWWRANGSRAHPLLRGEDAFVEGEFWNFLSGQKNTWTEMLLAFDELARSPMSERFRDLIYGNASPRLFSF